MNRKLILAGIASLSILNLSGSLILSQPTSAKAVYTSTTTTETILPNVNQLNIAISEITSLDNYATFSKLDPNSLASATPFAEHYTYLFNLVSVARQAVANYDKTNETYLRNLYRALTDAAKGCRIIFSSKPAQTAEETTLQSAQYQPAQSQIPKAQPTQMQPTQSPQSTQTKSPQTSPSAQAESTQNFELARTESTKSSPSSSNPESAQAAEPAAAHQPSQQAQAAQKSNLAPAVASNLVTSPQKPTENSNSVNSSSDQNQSDDNRSNSDQSDAQADFSTVFTGVAACFTCTVLGTITAKKHQSSHKSKK